MTKAVPPGRWLSRNRAVARAEVHSAWSGISRPEVASRAERSLGVYIELLVSTRKLRPPSRRARTNRSAPAPSPLRGSARRPCRTASCKGFRGSSFLQYGWWCLILGTCLSDTELQGTGRPARVSEVRVDPTGESNRFNAADDGTKKVQLTRPASG